MSTLIEQIAIEALREITKSTSSDPVVLIAHKALDQIEQMQKPTVHHLSAADVVLDKPPGGGL